MFGLSIKERLINLIEVTCTQQIGEYKEYYINCIDDLKAAGDDETTIRRIATEGQRVYFNAVSGEMMDKLNEKLPTAAAKFSLCMLNPSICGYDISIDNGISVGMLYAMWYYSITGRIARGVDCSKFNHFEKELMQNVLRQIGSELGVAL